MRPAKQLTLHN